MQKLSFPIKVVVFLIINFLALGLGSWLQQGGITSEWYNSMNQAPWTPPGWFFGVAWFTIMICFAFYMAKAVEINKRSVLILFSIQFILNVIWNPIFFYFQEVILGLIIIADLTLLIGMMFILFRKQMKIWSLLILPYLVWLIVATSLNAYILINN